MDTLSWMLLSAALAAASLGLAGALWHVSRRDRQRLARSARRCRAVMKELDTTTLWLKQAREQNVVLRERLSAANARQSAAARAAPGRRGGPAAPQGKAVPTLNDGVEVGVASWRAFADTQADENAHPAFQATRPMNLAA